MTEITYREALEQGRYQHVNKPPRAKTTNQAPPPVRVRDMLYISERPRKNGDLGFLVNLRKTKGAQSYVFRATFNSYEDARAARDQALKAYQAGVKTTASSVVMPAPVLLPSRTTVRDLIVKRITEGKSIGRSARQVLNSIAQSDFGSKVAAEVSAKDLRDLATFLDNGKRKPQTIASYLTPLAYVFKWAHNRDYEIQLEQVRKAMATLWEDGKISKSSERSRRPHLNELELILTEVERNPRQKIPLAKIIMFALFSARRISEIFSLEWADLQENDRRILVRKMKHPRKKETNDRWCNLTPEALALIQSMPRTHKRIFPYDAKSAGTAFQRHRDKVGVQGLRFHDLRHEAISRLFEMHQTDRFVALISGHQIRGGCLDRYAHIERAGDKFKNWVWLPRVIEGFF